MGHIRNPSLTQLGFRQAEHLRDTFPYMDRITHIMCSPLKRTLQTCVTAFKPLLEDGLRVVCWEELREFGVSPAQTGDPLPVLKEFINGNPVDISSLWDGWEISPYKTPPTLRSMSGHVLDLSKMLSRFMEAALNKDRGPEAHEELDRFGKREIERKDVELLIVSHNDLLCQLGGISERGKYYISDHLPAELKLILIPRGILERRL